MHTLTESAVQFNKAAAARKVEESEWLTVAQVSAITRLPEKTLRDHIKRGMLRAYRFGTSQQLRIRRSDVDAGFKIVQPTKAGE